MGRGVSVGIGHHVKRAAKDPGYLSVERQKKSEYNRRHYHKRKMTRERTETERRVLWRGHLPETLLGRLQRMVNKANATGEYPWRTMTEAVIQLVIKGLGTMKDDELVSEIFPYVEASQRLSQIRNLRREAFSMLNMAKAEIQELLAIGSPAAATTCYHATIEDVEKMPPTEYRDWLLKELRAAHPHLAKAKPIGVRLTTTPHKQQQKKFVRRRA